MSEQDRKDWTTELLADVAARPAHPEADFMARLFSDAYEAQNLSSAQVRPARRKVWTRWLQMPWLGAGGLVAAAMCGIWIGFAPPDVLGDYLSPAVVAVDPYQVIDVYAMLEE